MDFKSFDWGFIKRLAHPQAANDLNDFLEKLPQTAGNTALIAAGIAWLAAGATGLYATIQTQQLLEMKTELKEMEALKPMVPQVRDVPVDQASVKSFVESMEKTYPNINVLSKGAAVQVKAKSVGQWGEFREAVGHVQNGGSGWRVSVDRMCVGRECDSDQLIAVLKINKVSVTKPE